MTSVKLKLHKNKLLKDGTYPLVFQIIHNRRDRLIYLFDMFGDRAYFLELTGTFEADKGASYPHNG